MADDHFQLLKQVPLLILDLDGTVRHCRDDVVPGFVNGVEDVKVYPEAVRLMYEWKARGGRIIAVTNQGGVALGYLSADDVNAAMTETHRQCDMLFDAMAACPHHPDATEPHKARCWCRKPKPGLAIIAVQSLARRFPEEDYPPHLALFVGDRPEDEACAEALDVDFMWAHTWRSGRHPYSKE